MLKYLSCLQIPEMTHTCQITVLQACSKNGAFSPGVKRLLYLYDVWFKPNLSFSLYLSHSSNEHILGQSELKILLKQKQYQIILKSETS